MTTQSPVMKFRSISTNKSLRMKKFSALALLTMLLWMHATAQQVPLYSQLYFMRLLYNPALTAYNGSSDAYGFYRDQWTGLPGHPVTAGGLAEMSLWKDQIGTGINVYSDNTDIIHRVSAQLYYAQKIKLAKDQVLSLGFSGGIFNATVDYNNAIAADPGDNHLLPSTKGATAFDMNVGLAYQWRKLTIGFSIPQVAATKATILDELQSTTFSMKRQYIGSASYEFSFENEKYNIEPSILVMNGGGEPVQIDANVMANFKRIAYLGIGYRSNYGLAAMAAVSISKMVTIGYAYEYPILSDVQYANTKGTHEIIFGIHFDKWMKAKEESGPKLDMLDTMMTEQKALRKDVDSLRKNMDSVFHLIDSMQKQVDTVQKQMDTVQKQHSTQKQQSTELDMKFKDDDQKMLEHDQALKDLKQRMDSITNIVRDSLDNLLKEYKKHISENPAVNFPEKVDNNVKAKVGDVYRLNKVEFNTNSSYLTKESYPELDKVVEFLKLNPNSHIRVSGHTDYTASDDYNQWLSDRRAKRVYDYLQDKGIAADRMTYIGFGRKAPIADNNTEEGRALNRRVEMEVTK